MLVVIDQHNADKHTHLIDQMFRLRARVFQERLKWDVRVADGRERDKYDDMGPLYIIYADDEGREVKGSLRLLPTTGPTLLAEFFSDTLPDAVHLSAPTIWECTRFCLNDKILDKEGSDELLNVSAVLVEALGDVAIGNGIESIVGNFDFRTLQLYRNLGFQVDVLGSTSKFGQAVYLGLFPISEPILRRVKRRLNDIRSVLAKRREMAA
jgi:acyl homoserine lactone synthase